VIYTMNAIEALNRQLRKAIKTKGHFPCRPQQAAIRSQTSVRRVLTHRADAHHPGA